MESSGGGGSDGDRQSLRAPLSRVVSDCARRWFQDSLKEAKSGDVSMQVLVGQMYYSGYGVPRDAHKIGPYSCPQMVGIEACSKFLLPLKMEYCCSNIFYAESLEDILILEISGKNLDVKSF
ncbi:hypothetical protein Acr_11g0000630 [Actinidia rufa]|uniref:Uncharacterized protein n=1 Tax=Actinidia rufa TaxID=165716 RepID=A0A7J0FCW7_9ERIC|nr:hypothetical protein Acr_11g0000630 [Actinidia rufa]